MGSCAVAEQCSSACSITAVSRSSSGWPSRRADRVLFGARAASRPAAAYGIRRMRFALGVEEDLRPFLARFARDPLIGRSVRGRPWLRASRRPEPFEALAWAICEQLIEYERAAAIQRRMLAALGRRASDWDGADSLRDLPTVTALAGTAPALLQSFDLAGSRALALVRSAREVACGRVDLHSPEHERAWRGLRAIPGIGTWTVEMLALHGQGRHDQVPAGDLSLLKLVGRALGGGTPARAPRSTTYASSSLRTASGRAWPPCTCSGEGSEGLRG